MSFDWFKDEVFVTLFKGFGDASITWNPRFTDPSWGERANKITIPKLGNKVIITIRYAWNDSYANRYDVFRIWIDKKTETGSWVEIPGGFHETNAAEFGNPEGHSEGHYDKNFEIVADEPIVPFRVTAAILTGMHGGGSGTWDYMKQTRQFQIGVNQCKCCR